MKLLLFENHRNSNINIIEIFGLPKSGKTTLLKYLKKNNKNVIISSYQKNPHIVGDTSLIKSHSFSKKLLVFINHFTKHPIKTTYLFYKLNTNWITIPELKISDHLRIFIIRNSYLASVISKYYIAKNQNQTVYLDELIFQSLFIILQKKSTENEINKTLKRLPKPEKILLIEVDEVEREKRSQKSFRETPTSKLSLNYLKTWRKNQEFNYNIIKIILKKYYQPYREISLSEI